MNLHDAFLFILVLGLALQQVCESAPPIPELVEDVKVRVKRTSNAKSRTKRIVEGSPAEKGKYSFMAAVVKKVNGQYYQICGASVISNRCVLTAAHCFKDIGADQARIWTNIYNLEVAEEIEHEVSGIVTAHGYGKQMENDNDMAIAVLKTAVDDSKITPVCLSSADSNVVNAMATVIGWGDVVYDDNKGSDVLRETDVLVYSNDACDKAYSVDYSGKHMLCAGPPEGTHHDACQGDSGGPLFITHEGEASNYTQIGIVSYGEDCGNPTKPGVYTKISAFADELQGLCGSVCVNTLITEDTTTTTSE